MTPCRASRLERIRVAQVGLVAPKRVEQRAEARPIRHRRKLREQSAEMTRELFSVLNIPFEKTTELQRQLLASWMIVHQPTAHAIALMRLNVYNRFDQEGTGIGGGKHFQFFIVALRHA